MANLRQQMKWIFNEIVVQYVCVCVYVRGGMVRKESEIINGVDRSNDMKIKKDMKGGRGNVVKNDIR